MPNGPDDIRARREQADGCSDIVERARAARRTVVEAAPDALVAAPTPRSKAAERQRREFRARVDDLGGALGFSVSPDGTWTSASGLEIITRVSERPVTLAAGAHFVEELCRRARGRTPACSVLFVVESVSSAEMFQVAVRQRGCRGTVRVVAVDELEDVAAGWSSGVLDAEDVVSSITPMAGIDGVPEAGSSASPDDGAGQDGAS